MPTVLPARLSPLEVTGTGFREGEEVVVLVLGGAGRASERVAAAADGTWTACFPGLDASGRVFSVRAHGSAGSAAHWASRAARPARS